MQGDTDSKNDYFQPAASPRQKIVDVLGQTMLRGFSFQILPICFVIFAFLVSQTAAGNKSSAKQRGVSWVAGHKKVTEDDFRPLIESHIEWIVQTPFGWQRNYNSPTFALVTGGSVMWGETDEGLEVTTRLARKFGIKTLLKPHIWLRNSQSGKWRGDIEMDSEEDWQRWFECYREFILHYAKLAERNGIAALSVGTELHMTVKREQDWRQIIAEVRKVYGGLLTYSANWHLEFEEVQFWDALDFIGIQGYFPLAEKENPVVEEIVAGWEPHRQALLTTSLLFGKPVLFTEIGYRSAADAAIRPWEWPGRRDETATDAELETQANCYEAFFQTFWDKPWIAGAYFWKWYPRLSQRDSYRGRDFTPQHKPALKVLAQWYRRATE